MNQLARTTLVAASIALAAVSATALAQSVATTTAVSIEPYQLASSDGRAAVLARIERAASRLCTPETLPDRARMKVCRADNIERMIRQSNSPQLIAEWSGAEASRVASSDVKLRTRR